MYGAADRGDFREVGLIRVPGSRKRSEAGARLSEAESRAVKMISLGTSQLFIESQSSMAVGPSSFD
jgi:hypothetical protein